MTSQAISGMPCTKLDAKSFKAAWNSVMTEANATSSKKPARMANFSPYSDEGGTTAAISGDDFLIIGADTRMAANGFTVLTRHAEKIHILNNKVILGTAGFYGDMLQLVKVLRARMKQYVFNFHDDMAADSAAELLARTLYYKRFFPYYTANLLGGIDSAGKGCLYAYDPVGCIERCTYNVQGSATAMIDPFLDNQVGWKNQPNESKPSLTKERAQAIMKDAFRSAAERDTGTGDFLRLITLVKGQAPLEELVPLRND